MSLIIQQNDGYQPITNNSAPDISVAEEDQKLLDDYKARKKSGFFGNIVNGKVDANQIADLNRAGAGENERAAYAIAMHKGALKGLGSRSNMRLLQKAYNFDLGGRKNSNAVLRGVQVANGNRNSMSDRKYIRGLSTINGMQGSYVGSYRDQNGNIVHQNTGFGINGDFITGNFGFGKTNDNGTYTPTGGMFQNRINTGTETIQQFNNQQSTQFVQNSLQDQIFSKFIEDQNAQAYEDALTKLNGKTPQEVAKLPTTELNEIRNELLVEYQKAKGSKRYAYAKLLRQLGNTAVQLPKPEDYLAEFNKNEAFSGVQADINNNYVTNPVTGILERKSSLYTNPEKSPYNTSWVPGNNITIKAAKGGSIDCYKPGGDINPVSQKGQIDRKTLLGAVVKLALNKSNNNPNKAKTLIPQILQGVQGKDKKIIAEVEDVIKTSKEEELAQLGQQLDQQLNSQPQPSQYPMARFGAKLDYIKSLKNECPDGYSVHYFSKGGGISKTCIPCMEKAKAALAEKGCKAPKKSSCKKKLQGGGVTPDPSNTPTSQDIDSFYKSLQQELKQQFLQNHFIPTHSALIPQPEVTSPDPVKLPNPDFLSTQDEVFIPSRLNARKKLKTLKTLKTNKDIQAEVENRITNLMANAIRQSHQ